MAQRPDWMVLTNREMAQLPDWMVLRNGDWFGVRKIGNTGGFTVLPTARFPGTPLLTFVQFESDHALFDVYATGDVVPYDERKVRESKQCAVFTCASNVTKSRGVLLCQHHYKKWRNGTHVKNKNVSKEHRYRAFLTAHGGGGSSSSSEEETTESDQEEPEVINLTEAAGDCVDLTRDSDGVDTAEPTGVQGLTSISEELYNLKVCQDARILRCAKRSKPAHQPSNKTVSVTSVDTWTRMRTSTQQAPADAEQSSATWVLHMLMLVHPPHSYSCSLGWSNP